MTFPMYSSNFFGFFAFFGLFDLVFMIFRGYLFPLLERNSKQAYVVRFVLGRIIWLNALLSVALKS